MTYIRNKEYKRPYGNENATLDELESTIGTDNIFEIKEHIDYIIAVVNGNSNEWLVIKNMLQRYLPLPLRIYFSSEDYSTRKQKPNDFDYAVMNYWKEKTGIELFIPEHKMHPKDHVYRPRGWKLAVINELKKRKAIEEGKREPDAPIPTQLGKKGTRGRPKEYKYNIYDKFVREYLAEEANKRSNQESSSEESTTDNPNSGE